MRDVTSLTSFTGAKSTLLLLELSLRKAEETAFLVALSGLYSKLPNYFQRTEALQPVCAPNASNHLDPYSAGNGSDGELGKPFKIYSHKTHSRKENGTLSEKQ